MGKRYLGQSSVVFMEPEWVDVSLPYSSPVSIPFSSLAMPAYMAVTFLVLRVTPYWAQSANFVSFK